MSWHPFFTLAVTERQPDGTTEMIAYIPLDVRESSDLSLAAQVSDNPIESGRKVADHVIKDPVLISVAGLVSEHPAGFTSSQTQTGANAQVLPGSRSQSCYQALKEAWDKSSPITVINELGVFDDMMITGLSFPRDKAQGGDGIWFTLDLKQVTVVESESASLPPDVVDKVKRRRKATKAKQSDRQIEQKAKRAREASAGKVSTLQPSEANATQARSLSTTWAAASGSAR